MCKLMIMSGITEETQENALAFSKVMAKEMSTMDKDGLGYAAIDKDGNLFGERWVKNSEAFQHRNTYGTEIDSDILKRFNILKREKVYGSFGNINDDIRSITMHARSATNSVSYKNTHPFVDNFTSVVHNGVIYNEEEFVKKTSTCDSEVVLHQYIKYDIANRPGKIKKLANRLEGYYALGIFSRTREGLVILDIIKDNAAKLEAFFIKELNTIVFATPRMYTNPVEDACKTLGFNIVSKYEVKSNRLQRMNALTGATIGYESFKPKEFVKTTYPVKTNWSETYYHGANTYGANTNTKPYADDKKFDDVFTKSNPKKNDAGSNVIDIITTHSKKKHDELVKERLLGDILQENKEYTKEEVEALIKENADLLKGIEEEVVENGETTWSMDERLTWSKKSLA